MSLVLEVPDFLDRSDETRAFTTYKNYWLSLAQFIASEYGNEQNCFREIRGKCESLRLEIPQRNTNLSAADEEIVRNSLFNCWNTELVLRLPGLPPQLHRYSNHWAPVQAYYAIYLCLRAYLKSSGNSNRDSHASGLRELAHQLRDRQLMPPFWNVTSSGETGISRAAYRNLPDGIRVSNVSSISIPSLATFWNRYAMLLRTTRERQLEARLEEKTTQMKYATKGGKPRKRFSVAQKNQICSELPSTTIFDFFYRLRIRSNYEDANAFLFGNLNDREAKMFHDAVSITTTCTLFCLERLITHRLGRDKMLELVQEFQRGDIRNLSRHTVLARSEHWW